MYCDELALNSFGSSVVSSHDCIAHPSRAHTQTYDRASSYRDRATSCDAARCEDIGRRVARSCGADAAAQPSLLQRSSTEGWLHEHKRQGQQCGRSRTPSLCRRHEAAASLEPPAALTAGRCHTRHECVGHHRPVSRREDPRDSTSSPRPGQLEGACVQCVRSVSSEDSGRSGRSERIGRIGRCGRSSSSASPASASRCSGCRHSCGDRKAEETLNETLRSFQCSPPSEETVGARRASCGHHVDCRREDNDVKQVRADARRPEPLTRFNARDDIEYRKDCGPEWESCCRAGRTVVRGQRCARHHRNETPPLRSPRSSGSSRSSRHLRPLRSPHSLRCRRQRCDCRLPCYTPSRETSGCAQTSLYEEETPPNSPAPIFGHHQSPNSAAVYNASWMDDTVPPRYTCQSECRGARKSQSRRQSGRSAVVEVPGERSESVLGDIPLAHLAVLRFLRKALLPLESWLGVSFAPYRPPRCCSGVQVPEIDLACKGSGFKSGLENLEKAGGQENRRPHHPVAHSPPPFRRAGSSDLSDVASGLIDACTRLNLPEAATTILESLLPADTHDSVDSVNSVKSYSSRNSAVNTTVGSGAKRKKIPPAADGVYRNGGVGQEGTPSTICSPNHVELIKPPKSSSAPEGRTAELVEHGRWAEKGDRLFRGSIEILRTECRPLNNRFAATEITVRWGITDFLFRREEALAQRRWRAAGGAGSVAHGESNVERLGKDGDSLGMITSQIFGSDFVLESSPKSTRDPSSPGSQVNFRVAFRLRLHMDNVKCLGLSLICEDLKLYGRPSREAAWTAFVNESGEQQSAASRAGRVSQTKAPHWQNASWGRSLVGIALVDKGRNVMKETQVEHVFGTLQKGKIFTFPKYLTAKDDADLRKFLLKKAKTGAALTLQVSHKMVVSMPTQYEFTA